MEKAKTKQIEMSTDFIMGDRKGVHKTLILIQFQSHSFAIHLMVHLFFVLAIFAISNSNCWFQPNRCLNGQSGSEATIWKASTQAKEERDEKEIFSHCAVWKVGPGAATGFTRSDQTRMRKNSAHLNGKRKYLFYIQYTRRGVATDGELGARGGVSPRSGRMLIPKCAHMIFVHTIL